MYMYMYNSHNLMISNSTRQIKQKYTVDITSGVSKAFKAHIIRIHVHVHVQCTCTCIAV